MVHVVLSALVVPSLHLSTVWFLFKFSILQVFDSSSFRFLEFSILRVFDSSSFRFFEFSIHRVFISPNFHFSTSSQKIVDNLRFRFFFLKMPPAMFARARRRPISSASATAALFCGYRRQPSSNCCRCAVLCCGVLSCAVLWCRVLCWTVL